MLTRFSHLLAILWGLHNTPLLRNPPWREGPWFIFSSLLPQKYPQTLKEKALYIPANPIPQSL